MAEDGEPQPNATVYVRNLDERAKIPALTEALREVFSEYGNIINIVAKKSIKRKGQAFIIFDDIESAQSAIDEVQGFELFDKQMHLEFAKTRSDITVKLEDGEEELEKHKKHRLAEKERKQALEAANEKQTKRTAADTLAERPAKTAKPAAAAGGVVPDEYLPPNKILFLRELPETTTQEELVAVFGGFPGFKEVRMVTFRKGIAFVEFENEDGAITAKESTAGMSMGEAAKPIRITFQRQ